MRTPLPRIPQSMATGAYGSHWGSFQNTGISIQAALAHTLPIIYRYAIYAPEVKKTFFVYGGTTTADEKHLLIMISVFRSPDQDGTQTCHCL